MNIYVTSIQLRAVCHTCGKIYDELSTFPEPLLLDELEVAANEIVEDAGIINNECEDCIASHVEVESPEEREAAYGDYLRDQMIDREMEEAANR